MGRGPQCAYVCVCVCSIQLPTNELPTAPYRLLLLDHFASLVRSTGDFPSTLVHIWPAAPKKKRVTFIAQAQIPKNAAGRLGHRGKLLSLFRPLMCVECRVPKERGKMKKGWPRLGPHAHTCTCSRHVLRNTSISIGQRKQSLAVSLGIACDSDFH